jgi:hypothetical protein
VVHLGQAVLDGGLVAHAVEDVLDVPDVLLARRELDAPGSGPGQAVVGQHRVDLVGHRLDQGTQEPGCLHLAGALHELDPRVRLCRPEGRLRRTCSYGRLPGLLARSPWEIGSAVC